MRPLVRTPIVALVGFVFVFALTATEVLARGGHGGGGGHGHSHGGRSGGGRSHSHRSFSGGGRSRSFHGRSGSVRSHSHRGSSGGHSSHSLRSRSRSTKGLSRRGGSHSHGVRTGRFGSGLRSSAVRGHVGRSLRSAGGHSRHTQKSHWNFDKGHHQTSSRSSRHHNHGNHDGHGNHDDHSHHGWGIWLYPGYGTVYGYQDYGYYNPYYIDTLALREGPYVDDSQPIPADDENARASKEGTRYLALAREAFFNGDYQTALKYVSHAVVEMPGNHDAHQFRSLVFFALKDYKQSAAAAHVALNAGPGWNWSTLRSFYAEAAHYTVQLRALEKQTVDNPKNVAARFTRSYHYLMMGHTEAARMQLLQVVKLEPRDALAAHLLKVLSEMNGQREEMIFPQRVPPKNQNPTTPQAVGTNPVESNPISESPPVKVQPPKKEQPPSNNKDNQAKEPDGFKPPAPPKLNREVGTWKASPAKGVVFQLELAKDNRFSWSVTDKSNTNKFSGKYTLVDNLLTLTRDGDGQKLNGTFDWKGEKNFDFKMKGSPPGDPGLKFSR